MKTDQATRDALRQALERAMQPGVVYVPLYHLQDWLAVLDDADELGEIMRRGAYGEWVHPMANVDGYRVIGEAGE